MAKRKTIKASGNITFKTPLGALLAEFVGTFIFAAIVVTTQGQPIFILFGLTAIVLAVGALSGAHVNPAITFAAWATKRIHTLRAVGYIIAQVLGAMLALVVLNALLNGQPAQVGPTGGSVSPELFKAPAIVDGKEWYTFFAEMLGAAIFGLGVASAFNNVKDRIASAFSIGGGLFLGLIVAGSTAILNPAVAVALQAIKWDTWSLATYIFASTLGMLIGFVLYNLFQQDIEAVEGSSKKK